MDAAEIEAHLVEVAEILREADPTGPVHKIVIAGGALLAWIGLRDATRDVDSVEPIAPEVAAAAAEVAGHHDLPPAWLNDSSRGFLPEGFSQADCRVLLRLPRLLVLGISDQMAFLMKINAARARGVDFHDAARLWPTAGYLTAQDAADAYWRAYSHEDPASDPHFVSYIEQVIAYASG